MSGEARLDGDIDGSRKLVKQYERHQVEGAVFVTLRVQAQFASAAATALIPGTSRISREDFMAFAGQAYDDTELASRLLVEMAIDEREAALNPPPPIVDVG